VAAWISKKSIRLKECKNPAEMPGFFCLFSRRIGLCRMNLLNRVIQVNAPSKMLAGRLGNTMTKNTSSSAYALKYHSCRNISAPEDEQQNRKIYSGHAPVSSVLDLEDNENVREYLVDAAGKERRRPTLVHQAIRKTLADIPDQFSVLNGGMVIVAREASVDDAKKVLYLNDASIINGSQTQGELKRYFAAADGFPPSVPSIRFEIIVTDDKDLVAEISIARNFQNDVRAISIAGRRGQLDELETAMQPKFPGTRLRKSESDLTSDGEFLDSEKLIQVTLALMPSELLGEFDDRMDASNKVFAYSQKTRCLKLYQRMVEEPTSKAYKCALNLAPTAWELYMKWKSHQGFQGTGLRAIERDGREIIDVPDGIVFPIIAAHAAFVAKVKGNGWAMAEVESPADAELIETAKQDYMEIAKSNPQTMGKSKACYSSLLRYATLLARLKRA
jgi:AIPR protein